MSSVSSQLPWIEKYRPKKLDDVVHQDEVVDALRNTLTLGNLPHLLFYGPPGTGKTSTILAVARELFGPDLVKSRVLELNASHERGIDVIRDRVKVFAQVAINTREKVEGHPCPPFKIVILDEADCMTKDAQSALRRTMENYAGITRFCIICNYVSRIIEPITSRCAKFRFKSVEMNSMLHRLEWICGNEGVKYAPNALPTLIKLSQGDLRRAITLLQTSSYLIRSSPTATQQQSTTQMDDNNDDMNNYGMITQQIIYEVSANVSDDTIQTIWASVQTGDINVIKKQAQWVIRQGYCITTLLQRLLEYLYTLNAQSYEQNIPPVLSDISLSQLSLKIAQIELRLNENASSPLLQLLDVLSCAVELYITNQPAPATTSSA